MQDTDNEWIKWGTVDPYFAVLSCSEFRKDSIAANRAAFFQSGEMFIEHSLQQIDENFGTLERGSALDFGSGVGRLTIPLCRRFKEVVGVDVSPGMREEAAKNLAEAGLTNCEQVSSLPELGERRFDLVISYIVLQHIPCSRGYQIIADLLSRLKIGGVAHLHCSLRRELSPLRRLSYNIRQHVPFAHNVMNVLQGKPARDPKVLMNEYDLPTVLRLFAMAGISSPRIELEQQRVFLTAYISGKRRG